MKIIALHFMYFIFRTIRLEEVTLCGMETVNEYTP